MPTGLVHQTAPEGAEHGNPALSRSSVFNTFKIDHILYTIYIYFGVSIVFKAVEAIEQRMSSSLLWIQFRVCCSRNIASDTHTHISYAYLYLYICSAQLRVCVRACVVCLSFKFHSLVVVCCVLGIRCVQYMIFRDKL
jgi:hypothetical protein